jgi:hypothetical protein
VKKSAAMATAVAIMRNIGAYVPIIAAFSSAVGALKSMTALLPRQIALRHPPGPAGRTSTGFPAGFLARARYP